MTEQKVDFKELINKDKVSISDIAKGQTSVLTGQYQIVSLPSKGWTYDQNSKLSSGEIKLKMPSGKNEALLSSQNLIKKGTMIDEFIKSLILDNINYDDMLIGDKNFLIFASRRLTFGNEYKAKVQCKKCEAESDMKIDLSKIKFKETPELFQYPREQKTFELTLPTSKKVVIFKLNTIGLQKEMTKRIKSMRRPNQQVLIRTAVLMQSIGDITQFKNIFKELLDLPSLDTLAIRQKIASLSPDLDVVTNFECPECYTEQEVRIPLQEQFFWPSNNTRV